MHTPVRFAAILATAAACAAVAACGSSSSSPSSSSSTGTSGTGPAGTAAPASTAAAGSSASAGTEQAFPVTVTASNGAVTITAKPARIVSLDPTSTEDLYGVGAGAQVVAVDDNSNYPSGVPKTALSGLTPNIEAIARYNPSLVVASQDVGGLVKALGKLGIPVLIESAPGTLDGAYAQLQQIGQATGHAAQAAALVASMKQQIAASVRKAGASHGALTYYWELSAKPFYSVTSQTFIGEVVGLFGLKNIADPVSKTADGGYPQLTQEYIVTARPAVIFLSDNEAADGGQSPAVVARRPGWAGIPAVKNGEVIGLNDDVASRWGPRLPLLVAEIAQAVEQAGR
jgi:iron complex transport system substrate-binding protein